MKTSILVKNKLFIVVYVLLGMLFSIHTAFAQKEAEKIKTYLQANANKHHLSANDVKEMTISSQYLSPTTGWYHVYYNQVYQSIEVYNGILNATFVKDRVEYVGNNFVENIATKVPAGGTGFQQSPLSAVNKAAAYLGLTHNPANTIQSSVIRLTNGQVSKAIYTNAGLSNEAIPVKLYWFPHTDSTNGATSLHLVWSVSISGKDYKNYWVSQVDAYSGEVLHVDDQVIKCNFDGPEHAQQHEHLPINSAITPAATHARLTPLAANSYNVFDYPIESPSFGSRTIVTNPYTKFAPTGTGPGSTNGWHDDGTTTYTTTRGNNVLAKEDVDANNESVLGTSPTSAILDFDYPYTQGLNTAEGNRNAAITNLFYWTNLIHDVLWKYGFDEPSGNFQNDNMGRGGLGNDYLFADAQDGLGTNNANFGTPTDGLKPRMQMYLWTYPSTYQADSDFDNGVISHEYGHGWSTRLTGGPAINSCLTNVEQAGEGWSDYLSLMMTTKWSTLTPSIASASIGRGMGTYGYGQTNSGNGVRGFRYSYAKDSLNPNVTYDKVATYGYPHGIGSIWTTMLWDMTWEIIFQDNQIVNDIYNTTQLVGNVAALKLVNEGLRLQKCNPSFVDARNAILKADSLLFNSRYKCAIWKAFARRGLGVNATTGVSSNDRIVVQDFTPMTNNGWVLSSPAEAIVCSRSVFNYTATVTGAGTPTFGWVREAITGIDNAAKSGNTATINETLINTTNNPIVVTYRFFLSPSSCQVPLELKVVVEPAPTASVATYEICKDGTVPVGQGLVATSQTYTNIVNGILNTASPTYNRGVGNNITVFIPGPENGMYYHTHSFVPASSGSVSIETIAGTLNGYSTPYDTYLTLYQTSFNPTDAATNFLIGDDDSGTLEHASKITYNLTAGTTYILVVTTYDTGMTGTYQIKATADIFGGPNSWYATDTDTAPLATGNIFNPVGVAGSGIANTATPLTKTFYLGSPFFTCRTATTFTVNGASVGGSIAGSANICADLNKGELTLSGHTRSVVRWESSTNNFANVTQIADTAITITYTNLTQTTQFRAVVKNGGCPTVNSAIATITRINPSLPAVTNYSVCQNTGLIFGSGLTVASTNYGNKVSGMLVEDSPIYNRPGGDGVTVYSAAGEGANAGYYRTHTFVAPTTGIVSIETIGGSLNGAFSPYDTYLSLYQDEFSPANPAINFLMGDDDSGTLPYSSKITYDLTEGATYVLVVTTYGNGERGGYEIQATANIFGGSTINWYDHSTGGTSLATGSIFNPIGVPGTGVINTSTVLSKTFFIASPDAPTCRVPAVFTIDEAPSGGPLAGGTTACSNTNAGTLTLSGYVGSITKWESSTDNFATANAIANTSTSLAYSNITQTTQYRVVINSGICDAAFSHNAIIVRTNSAATTTDYSICKDATIPVGEGLMNTNPGYTNTLSGTFTAESPSYWRSTGENESAYRNSGIGSSRVHYKAFTFTPTSTGLVTIETMGGTITGGFPFDTYFALYKNSFDPGLPANNFFVGNDDGAALLYGSKLIETLTAGTTYILVISTYANDQTGTFEVQASANIFGNPNNWYGNSSGGTVLGTGNIFNPVGVAGSGITSTATPIVKTFHTGLPSFGSCLSPATFTISPSTVGGSLSGSNTFCSATNSGTLTLSGQTGSILRWESSTDNFATNTPIINTTASLNYSNLPQSTQYRAVVKSGVCAALNSAVATIQTATLNTITGSARCSTGTSTLTATGCNGGTINWYTALSGGSAIATGTSYMIPGLTTTTTYYVNCTLGACVPARTPVDAAIGTTTATYSTFQTAGNYHVSQTISSSANVATGVSYFAGKAIILTPGFQAGGDEVFSASIKDCQ